MEESTTVDFTHDDGAQVQDETPSDYYRSQQEVDSAFQKRFSGLKNKWEREHELELSIGRAMLDEIAPAAERQELDEFAEIEEEFDLSSTGAEEDMDEETRQFVDDVMNQAYEAEEMFPDIDIAAEMDNPRFAAMIAAGEPVADVLHYFYPERIYSQIREEAKREVINRIKTRNLIPTPISPSGGNSVRDVSAMSREQIMELDRRVRNGERVIL